METNEKNCILSSMCKLAGSKKCTMICPSYVSLQGSSGTSGRIGAANIPNDYRMLNVRNNPIRNSQQDVFSIIDQYIKSFDRMHDVIADPKKRIKGLFLYSESTGTGKTATACSILNTWVIKDFFLSVKNQKVPTQRPAFYLSMMDFHTLYNQYTRPGVPEDVRQKASAAYYDKMEIARTVPLLCVDDIGVRTDVTDAFRGDIHSIIDDRTTNLLPTIYTSNLPLSQLNEVFIGDKGRLADRIREQTLEIHFKGKSNRGIRK